MYRVFFYLVLLALPNLCFASIQDCKNLYVGRISVNENGLKRAVFLTRNTDSSGSYWVGFENFSEQGKSAILSLLVASKLSGHRLDLYTSEEGRCGIANGYTQAVDLHMANFM